MIKNVVLFYFLFCSFIGWNQWCSPNDSLFTLKKKNKNISKCYYEDTQNIHVHKMIKYRKWGRYKRKEKFLLRDENGKVVSRWRDRARTGDWGEKVKGVKWTFKEKGKLRIRRTIIRGRVLH